MTDQPEYKSLKVTFETWQAITRLSAQTGEPRTRLIERLVRQELEKRPVDSDLDSHADKATNNDRIGKP